MPVNAETGLYEFEDISFVNTAELVKAGKHYEKHGVYTFAPEDSIEYLEFWEEEERKRIEGVTLPGQLMVNEKGETYMQEVHVPGEMYGFLNYAPILRTVDQDETVQRVFKQNHQRARKVGKKDLTFPDFWDGHYHYFVAKQEAFKMGLNVIVLKARRKGYSYIEAWDCADTVNLEPFVTTIIGAFDSKYILKGNQMMGMAKTYLDFLEDNTGMGRGYLHTKLDFIQMGYREEGSTIDRGYRSMLMGLSCKDNNEAFIGKDGRKIKLEEMGKFPNMLEVIAVTQPTLEDGDIVTGQMVALGTGGTKESDWRPAQKIFYNPALYNFMAFDNIWDDGLRNTACGFFFPYRQNLNPYMDKHGNSDYAKADPAIEVAREQKRKDSEDNTDYLHWLALRCNTPREALTAISTNFLNAALLNNQLTRIRTDEDIKHLHRCGIIEPDLNGQMKFVTHEDLYIQGRSNEVHPPVFDYPLKSNTDPTGCVIEWFPPFKVNGQIPKGLYRIWNDPFAQDKDTKELTQKDSLGSTYIYEVPNNITPHRGDVLVAAYVGRPSTMDEYNNMLINLARYYSAPNSHEVVMFENDRGDVKNAFRKAGLYHMLCDEPEVAWKKELQSSSTGRDKGIMMNEKRKPKGLLYYKQWMEIPRGKDPATGRIIRNIDYVYDPALIAEGLFYNTIGNFDRMSTMLVGMFDAKETLYKGEIEIPKQEAPDGYFERPLFA